MPTYSPHTEADKDHPRPYKRLSNEEIAPRLFHYTGRLKPWVYMDAIDSILNTRPDINLVVVDAKSTDSVRDALKEHHRVNPQYDMLFYPERESQWKLFNDVIEKYAKSYTEYFVYTSSDVMWLNTDWVAECIKEFEKNPRLMIAFPCVNNGDSNLPCQVASGPRDMDSFRPPFQQAAKAPVLNAYAMVFRMDFLRKYGGYPTLFRNCYTESFLHHLCEAVDGEQRLVPRAWCYHWGTVDIWQENGSYYYYNEELSLFRDVMNKVQMAQGLGKMTPEFLKQVLWK